MIITVKAPKIRSQVTPRPSQVHRDRKYLAKKYACRNKGRKNYEAY